MAINAVLWLPIYTTSKASFCLSCHSNQMPSQFWAKSQVHPKIDCDECHAKGIEFVPKGFAAEAERLNPNCLRCHGDVKRKDPSYKYNTGKIKIPHRYHVDITMGECTICHNNVYHEPYTPPTYRPRMEACERCHDVKQPSSCERCHQS